MEPELHTYQISDEVTAFSSTRRGGVSEGAYGEFNINTFCGDDARHTTENLQLLAAELGIPADHVIVPHQVHGRDCRMITPDYFTLSGEEKKAYIDGFDAVMTNIPGVCVGVSTADCIPVLVYDARHHAAAAIHAGWRGTVQRIVEVTIREMVNSYGSDPAELTAVIGPGISLASFEVGDEVYEAFQQEGFDMNLIATKLEKWHVNLPLCNETQLIAAGLKPENIQNSGICTYQQVDDYFSARRLGIQSGRIYTGILMNI